MKKLALITAIVLGFGLTTYAAPGYGMFNRGNNAKRGHAGSVYFNGQSLDFVRSGDDGMPVLPNHGVSDNVDAPLGSGIALLTALGAAYLVGKRRKED